MIPGGDWVHDANCRDAEPELFYPSGVGVSSRYLINTYCRPCPVRIACLEAAIASERGVPELFGVRGGMTAHARAELRRRAA